MGATVELDDRGRITIPKRIREKLQIRPGDEFEIEEEEGVLSLHRETEALHKVRRGRKWGSEAFLDVGEATFGER